MKKTILMCLATILFLSGCAAIVLKPVDFSWSFESVLTTDANGIAKGEPKTIAFNVKEIFMAETQDPAVNVANKTVRIIRDREGYYYVTSPGFKHVYIFCGSPGELALRKKIMIAEGGMEKPFFNSRDMGIELVANGQALLLNKKGIIPPGEKTGEKK